MAVIERSELEGGVLMAIRVKELNASSAPEVFGRARELLGRAQALILDMQSVEFIDSSAIGAWVRFARELESGAVGLTVVGVGEQLMALVKMMRLDRIMAFAPDVDAAMARLEPSRTVDGGSQ